MKLIHGVGPQPSSLMIVGEAPGITEMREGRPFCGKTGVELDNLLMKLIQVSRDDCFVTNMVRYQLPEGQKHISHEDWDMFSTMLKQDIINTQPSVILSLGAIVSRFFMGDGPPQRTRGKKRKSLDDGEDITDTSGTWWTVETINAMPHWYQDGDYKCIVIPCYHPTAALKDPSRYPWLEDSFMAVREALRGNLVPLPVAPPTCVSDTELNLGLVVAIDTELYANGSLYTVQASSYEGESTVILAGSVPGHRMLSDLANHVSDPSVTTLLHNAMFDLPLLAGAGIHPSHWIDTMQVAFLLQTLPLGLKQLAYRLLNLKMHKYTDVVGDYPDLSFVEWNNVLEYAGTDPDATLRVFNTMLPMWYDRMSDILDRDMGIQPMIMSMMERGLLLDTSYAQDVHGDFVVRMLELRAKIEKYAWEGFNPGSGDQLAKLLYDQLGLARGKNLRKTKATDKKPSRYKTDAKTLKKLVGSHPIIDLTKQWKEVKDLATKYTGVLPSLVNGDGRIHAKISMIRVPHSGRLAISQPNLMAQPSKTEDGLRIRNCYVAPPGYKLVAIDQSQIEVRVMAHVSQDEQLLWAFQNDIDIHTASAMAAFRLPTADLVQPRQRKAAKCFHPDTEVLTRTGWKRIVDLTKGEEVIQAMPGKHGNVSLEWVMPLDVWTQHHPSKKLIHLSNNGINIRVTPDHRMLGWTDMGYPSVKLAKEFNESFRYWANSGNLDAPLTIAPVFLQLAVALQADGHITPWKGIRWGFSKIKKANRLRKLLTEAGIPFYEGIHSNGHNGSVVTFSVHKQDASCLLQLLDSDKTFPWWWLNLNLEARQLILDEIQWWDAKRFRKRIIMCSFMKKNLDVLQALAAISNKKSHLYENGIELSIGLKSRSRSGNVTKNEIDYTDEVACLSVPSTFVLVRDKGIPIICGQSVTFGVIYGISGKGLAETIGDGWTEHQCDNMISDWFKTYVGVKKYIEDVITHVKRYGWIEDLHGRRTRFSDIKSAYSDIREAAGRKAVNQTIQGGAQGIIKQSMVDMTPVVMEWKKWDLVHPLLQIHDELLFEVREDFIDVMVPVVMYYMENAVKLSIPTTVECKVGERWGSMKKWEG